MKNKNKKLLTKKGSVLVFSLFIMMISLIIGISLMSTTTVGRKSTLASAKSVNSFQVADSGIEYAYWAIRDFRWNEPDGNHELESGDLLDDVFSTCVNGGAMATVTGSANGGTYILYFYRGSGIAMNNCDSIANSRVESITKIKSVGTYNGITRSVEVDVDMTSL